MVGFGEFWHCFEKNQLKSVRHEMIVIYGFIWGRDYVPLVPRSPLWLRQCHRKAIARAVHIL